MTAARDLALARQRNYQLIVDTTLAWSAEKAVTPWAKMYRVVTAAVAKAAGVVFADSGNPEQTVATAAVRSFLDRVPTTGSIIGDIQTLDPGAITAEHEARARDIIDHWDATFFVADLAAEPGPKGDPGPAGPRGATGPAGPAGGGARTSRGQIDARDLPGTDLADKLRRAWGANDTREIIAQHGDVLDVKDSPLEVRAGSCLRIADVAQTEFSDQGRLYVRGSSAVFRNAARGTNFAGTKGWNFTNIGFEGQAHLKLFTPNPMDASGTYMVYSTIEGCSFDTFQQLVESPLLGATWDIRYMNNIYGQFAVKVGGSDNQLWTEGGKADWGQGNSVPNRRALLWFSNLEKTPIGGVYVTAEGSAALEVEGNDSRSGVKFVGATFEGRNAGEQTAGAVARVRGASVDFLACDFNYAMSNPGAGAASSNDRAFVDVSAGMASLVVCKFRRGNGTTAPFIARRGTGVVDTFGCREVPSKALVTATGL